MPSDWWTSLASMQTTARRRGLPAGAAVPRCRQVDAGLPALRWTRQQAIDFLVVNAGSVITSATSAIDRHNRYLQTAQG